MATPEDIALVRMIVGDVSGNPLFPILADTDYDYLLGTVSQDVWQAAIKAAIIISLRISSYPTRERAGNYEVWSEYAKTYLKALDNIVNTPVTLLPNLVVPYAGGISKQDMFDNDSNQDNNRPSIYQGFDKGERPYNHGNCTDDPNSFYSVDTLTE